MELQIENLITSGVVNRQNSFGSSYTEEAYVESDEIRDLCVENSASNHIFRMPNGDWTNEELARVRANETTLESVRRSLEEVGNKFLIV